MGKTSVSAGSIRKSDEIALEIDLPERRPFAPRYLRCEGRVGFVSRVIDDGIRLGMIVDRMQFRTAPEDESDRKADEMPFHVRSRATKGGGKIL